MALPTTDRRALIFLACFVFGVSLITEVIHRTADPRLQALLPPFVAGVDLNANDHLGSEYYSIAEAIADGRGFSDPFGVGSGPTAWMPPLYCYLLALLIVVLGSKPLVALTVLLLKNLTLVATGFALYRTGRRPASPVPPWVRLLLFAVWTLTFYRWFFQTTHDSWLLMLWVLVHFRLGVRYWNRAPGPWQALLWGVLGGLTLLSSPVLGLTWVALWVLIVARRQQARTVALALIPFLLIGGSWVARNRVVLDRWIPIKSNAGYDLYQANVADADGVISEHSFVDHPANEPEAYIRQGETAFVDGFRRAAMDHLRRNPGDYLRRVTNRLLAASLRYTPYFRWFEERGLVLRQLVYPLPWFGILIVVFLSRFRLGPEPSVALVVYGLVLVPYVLVSFYIRYSIPLALLQLLFCAWALEMLGELLVEVRGAKRPAA